MVLMCGEKSVVTKELLELALPDYMNQGIFKFVDALLDKKSQLVLESADRVFTDMTTTIKNLGLLSSKFRKIKILKEMERNHVPGAGCEIFLAVAGCAGRGKEGHGRRGGVVSSGDHEVPARFPTRRLGARTQRFALEVLFEEISDWWLVTSD